MLSMLTEKHLKIASKVILGSNLVWILRIWSYLHKLMSQKIDFDLRGHATKTARALHLHATQLEAHLSVTTVP